MRFLETQPLRRQIVVVACALLLIVAMAFIWSANRTEIERENEVRQEADSVARLASAYVTQFFDGLDAMASTLMRHPAILSLVAAESA